MSVYGHEYIDVSFDKGLFLSDTPDSIPEGYCSTLKNLTPNNRGELECRPNFIPTSVQGDTAILDTSISRRVTSQGPGEYFCSSYHKAFGLNPVGSNDPMILMESQQAGANGTVRWIKRDGITGQSFTMTATSMLRDICQYRDRFYGIQIGGTQIRRWEFGATTITDTLMATLSGFELATSIVSFRDRIFAAGQNRIYFTELASTGGYPENWNGGNNSITMPSLGAIITSLIVHNDRIFIFTTEGAYQLYAIGSPLNWSLTLINPNVRVYSKQAVALVKGAIVYTDQKNVYTLNSGEPVEIGGPIKEAFKSDGYTFSSGGTPVTVVGTTGTRILPYEDGFILALTFATDTAGQWVENPTPLYYYFNGNTWCEFEFGTVNSSIHFALLNVIQSKPVAAFTNEAARPTDILVELRSTTLSPKTYDIRVYTSRRNNNYVAYTNFINFPIELTTREFDLHPNGINLVRALEVILNHKNSIRTITWNIDTDGNAASTSDAIGNMGALGKNNDIVRIGLNVERAVSMMIRLTVLFSSSLYAQNTTSWPSIRIGSLKVKINSDTRQIPDRDYRT